MFWHPTPFWTFGFVCFSGTIPTIGVHGALVSSKPPGDVTNAAAWRSFVAKRRTNTWPCKASPLTSSAWEPQSTQAGLLKTRCALCKDYEACTRRSFHESPTYPNPRSLISHKASNSTEDLNAWVSASIHCSIYLLHGAIISLICNGPFDVRACAEIIFSGRDSKSWERFLLLLLPPLSMIDERILKSRVRRNWSRKWIVEFLKPRVSRNLSRKWNCTGEGSRHSLCDEWICLWGLQKLWGC